MLKKLGCFFLLAFFFPSFAEEKKSGYRYIIDNYFSKRQSAYYSRSFSLSAAFSLYREGQRHFKPFSSWALKFNQDIKKISSFGQLNLEAGLFFSKPEKPVLLELSPRIIIPETSSAFPLYLGLGAGLGFYPSYIAKKIPFLSASGQFLIGLRLLELYYNLGLSAELNLRIHYPFNESEVYVERLGQIGLVFQF